VDIKINKNTSLSSSENYNSQSNAWNVNLNNGNTNNNNKSNNKSARCIRGTTVMALADQLPLYLAMYKLIKYLYTLIHNFPKEYKYSLGEEILTLSWKVLDSIVLTNKVSNTLKKKYIFQSSVDFEKLVVRLRMAHELKLFNDKRMAYIITLEDEIEKMLGGWYKWAKARTS